ncbi:hypothetical protein DRE_04216 [Drechslerella stenobrocha 248]|uniref:Uncharacterized protein n=1 Tax=Drechslerella stenobrocha 248 TaxID=1043628 RepID=W7I2X7_9PEZI|nr:hypothetical protein DRE_04216 [Drechslerella stenobrocha 248]
MATANLKKQPATPSLSSPARSYKPPAATRSFPTARSSTPSKDRDTDKHHMKVDPSAPKAKDQTTTATTTASKQGSPFSAKAVARRRSTIIAIPPDASDAELEAAAEMAELKQKLVEAEAKHSSLEENTNKQFKALQARLNATLSEQARLEELLAAKTDASESLENDLKELQRAKRDQEKLFEAERAAFLNDKDEMSEKEEAQTQIIQRLKQALNSRERIPSDVPDTADDKPEADAPIVSPRVTTQKDKAIESLRAELTDAQNRFTEALKLEERKLRDATDQLEELRKTNAKLQEENESFQLLLGHATVSGDIRNGFLGHYADYSASSSPSKDTPSLGSTLAEEMESANQREDLDDYKKLEGENKSLKDENKAMALYINTMIERLLNSNQEGILDRTPAQDKALPPVPMDETIQPVGLGRSRSMLAKRPPIRASMPPPPRSPAFEEEEEAISPIKRSQTMQPSGVASPGHRRTQSDATKSPLSPTGNYNLVNNLYRPDVSSPSIKQTTFYTGPRFGTGPLSPTTRGASSSNSSDNGENKDHSHTLSGQMTGKTLRPLRLVDGAPPTPKESGGQTPRKVSNRQSWIPGWFNKGGQQPPLTPVEPTLTPAASNSSVE